MAQQINELFPISLVPGFDPQNPYKGGRRKSTSQRHHLTSTHAPRQTSTPQAYIANTEPKTRCCRYCLSWPGVTSEQPGDSESSPFRDRTVLDTCMPPGEKLSCLGASGNKHSDLQGSPLLPESAGTRALQMADRCPRRLNELFVTIELFATNELLWWLKSFQLTVLL